MKNLGLLALTLSVLNTHELESLETGTATIMSVEDRRALVQDYCVMCHSDALKTGGLTLESFDPARPEADTVTSEKVIRRLRTGMMPPSYASRPEKHHVDAFVSQLESDIDTNYFDDPIPGRRNFQRLNRFEYSRSITELLGLEVDVAALLPPDTISNSFDNISDVQGMSPTLMDSYIRAAEYVSGLAIGDRTADPNETTYKVPRTGSQWKHVEGAPLGTRGGVSVIHNFAADGEYVFKIQLHGSPDGWLFGRDAAHGYEIDGDEASENLEISLDGVRVALIEIDPFISETEPNGLNLQTKPIDVKAGPHRVSASFLVTTEAPLPDLLTPINHTLSDGYVGTEYGITTVPHLRDLVVSGPYNVTGISETPARRKIFTCRPTTADEEALCADAIVKELARRAYRRVPSELELEGLFSFYKVGREGGDFESGIGMALQAILTSPSFIFRLETIPVEAKEQNRYRITDVDLASRLSFFLWAGPPDDELMSLAVDGKLSEPGELKRQAKRMMADPRAEAIASRFGSQWLRLQDLHKLHPDAISYPMYDSTLADAMQRETELFFENLLREDRSVLELLTADYTFVNERLAKHYDIPNVTGADFRRVTLQGINENRRGLFGQGSILALTSIANRTSPVQRGKWVMEVLLGSPPPPPPPNVPELEETKAATAERRLSIRERMQEHRDNPACNSCHILIDPIGLALENFDVTGAWRIKDDGVAIDASGELYDGTILDGPLGLSSAMLNYSVPFLRTFTQSLMTYALGRRVEHFDMPTIRQIVDQAGQNENRLSGFILGVVDSFPFQMAASEPLNTIQ